VEDCRGHRAIGKELVAKAMHYNSPRRERPLVSVNCSAIPKELLKTQSEGNAPEVTRHDSQGS
jgi:transcriptional regulator with GAF, ATPase, and Fis domain